MNWLDFISSIINSIAWPAAFIVIVLRLRDPLQALLLDIKKFRYGEMELDFGKEVRRLEDQARTAGLKIPPVKEAQSDNVKDSAQIISDAMRLADDFPEPAVGLAWTAIENELLQAVMRLAISPDYPPYNSPLKNIELLQETGYIDSQTKRLLDRMRNLRNAAVHPVGRHSFQVNSADAREFVSLTHSVVAKLKAISRER
jgi:hypothetical protein